MNILVNKMDRLSVRQKQMEVVTSMLNLNAEWQPDWKFLIYDTIGQNILGPLMSVDKLKNHNVTEYLFIDKDREAVPDVSAIYFVLPTEKNIERICKDLTNHIYDAYYLNFISPLSRSKLEAIADAALMSDSAQKIKKVYDQYLNFIALEDNLFILRENEKEPISFYNINRNDATEIEINHAIDCIVDCLFSVLVTLNIIPIIRCPKGGPAEFVAEKLTKKIRETIRDSRNGLFDSKESKMGGSTLGLSFQRPLLCLVDRTVDMSTPLHHTWTYQALIHDLLPTELNKVQVNESDSKTNNKPKLKVYELDPGDKFWAEQRGSPFPQVADAVQRGLDEYKKREEELNSLKSTIGLDGPGDEIAMIAESTAKLTSAAKSLPELSENKRILQKHTTVASAVLDEIKNRKLDNFFEIEEKIMNRNLIDRASLDDMLTNPNYGQPSDKYRLFLISYICDNPQLTEDQAERYVTVLEELGCKRTAYDYLKQWKCLSITNVAHLQSSLQSSGGVLKTAGMFSKLMSQGSQFVMEGVKNLVLNERHLPLTKIIDGLMDSSSKSSQEAFEYSYFDPKALKDTEVQRKKVFQDAIVFVVGGGNYIEYQNLVDYCISKSRSATSSSTSRHVIYGATDLMNATQFLQQLERLDCT